MNVDDDAIDTYITLIEGLLRTAKYEHVETLLSELDPVGMSPVFILAVLTITWHGKKFLTTRNIFLEKAEAELRRQLGDERTESLLQHRR